MRELLRAAEECFHRDRTVSRKGTSQKLGCGGGRGQETVVLGFFAFSLKMDLRFFLDEESGQLNCLSEVGLPRCGGYPL